MKKLLIVFLLLTFAPVFSQQKPSIPKEPTVAEMKLQLAQKDVMIAQLKLQLIQAQAQLEYQQAQAELTAAQKAVKDATLPPETKK